MLQRTVIHKNKITQGKTYNKYSRRINHKAIKSKIERKAMIRNRYNYSTPPIGDIKGKEIQTRNN